MRTPVWIIIVNYKTPDLVIDCLQSLASQNEALCGGRVVVVDNASQDDSVARISQAIDNRQWAAWASVVASDRNGGFAYGNNVGIRMALDAGECPEYIWLLNPDTVVRAGAVSGLTGFLDTHPAAGIAGSLIESPEGGIECSAHRFPSARGELEGAARLGLLTSLLSSHVVSPRISGVAHECGWVSGASMMVRRSVVEHIGLMDEGFFLYYEEVDYCRRAKAAGWSIWYVPESRILHLEGAATGIRGGARRRASYWYDSRRRFFIKHTGVAGLVLADVFWAMGRLSFLLRAGLRLGRRDHGQVPQRFMLDLLWGDLRALLGGKVWALGRAGRRQ